MKHLRTYERINDGPQVGDYVTFDPVFIHNDIYGVFNNIIGQIVYIDEVDGDITKSYDKPFTVKLSEETTRKFSYFEFSDWNSDIEILKMKQNINKYNL